MGASENRSLLLDLHWNAAAYEIANGAIAIRVVDYDSSTFLASISLSSILSQVLHLDLG
jgi:hypothetical protein